MENINSKRILLIYPRAGASGELVRHMPLSILYAAADCIKNGFCVDILDLRIRPRDWKEKILSAIKPDTFLVGLSVLSGVPVKSASEASAFIKKEFAHLKIVWGGAHACFNSRQILENPDVDFAVSGYGSASLYRLAEYLSKGGDKISRILSRGLATVTARRLKV
jgi:anaerobic magnesium-protoporphyrin IX monomethyl ester cyclase